MEVTAAGKEIDSAHRTKGRKPRAFNSDYWNMMAGHYDIQVRTIGVGKSEQNGDEARSLGALWRHWLADGWSSLSWIRLRQGFSV